MNKLSVLFSLLINLAIFAEEKPPKTFENNIVSFQYPSDCSFESTVEADKKSTLLKLKPSANATLPILKIEICEKGIDESHALDRMMAREEAFFRAKGLPLNNTSWSSGEKRMLGKDEGGDHAEVGGFCIDLYTIRMEGQKGAIGITEIYAKADKQKSQPWFDRIENTLKANVRNTYQYQGIAFDYLDISGEVRVNYAKAVNGDYFDHEISLSGSSLSILLVKKGLTPEAACKTAIEHHAKEFKMGNAKDISRPCKLTVAGKELSGTRLEQNILGPWYVEYYGFTVGDTPLLIGLFCQAEKEVAEKQKVKLLLDTLRPAKK